MASYGFMRTSSTGNSNSSTRAGNDPYAGTSGATKPASQSSYAPVDPYAGTNSQTQQNNSAFTSGYTPQPQPGYTPQNYIQPRPQQQQMQQPVYTPTQGAVNNVTMPTGFENTMQMYNDKDYTNAMAAWSQTGLPAMQAMNNQQNANREFDFNSNLQMQQLGQTQWRDQQAADIEWGGLTLQQRLAQDASDQWGQEFNRTGQRDQRADWESDRGYQFDVTQANRDYEQSGQKIEIDRARQQADAEFQRGTLDVNQYKARIDRLAQIENNARMTASDRDTAAYQTGTLANQRYATDTNAQVSREQMQQAYQTAVMNAVGRNQAQNVRFMRG